MPPAGKTQYGGRGPGGNARPVPRVANCEVCAAPSAAVGRRGSAAPVSYTHLRAHETRSNL
eukprot:7724965-Lingulodinium_polyedra.AAC.1